MHPLKQQMKRLLNKAARVSSIDPKLFIMVLLMPVCIMLLHKKRAFALFLI